MNYLVPIDFSEQSKAAAQYAAALTRIWPGNLQLVHAIVPAEEVPSYVPVKTLKIQKNIVFEMFNFQEQLRKSMGVRSGSDIISGELTSRILKTAAREKSDLIVMGMQGMSGLRDYLYGSNTMALVEETTLPLLALPSEEVFNAFRHIVYVCDHQENDVVNLTSLGKIAAKFKAVLTVLSINAKTSESNISDFRTKVKQAIPFAAVNFNDRFHEEGVAEGLEEFVLTESADLIGVSTLKSALVRKMAGRSLAGEFTFQVDQPVLFFPS